MKKVIFLFSVLVVIISFCFIGCSELWNGFWAFYERTIETKTYSFNYNKMMSESEKIKIISIKSNISDGSLSEISKIDESYYTIHKMFDNDEIAELLFGLSKIKFTTFLSGTWNRYPQGLTLKIYYENSDYGFINHNTWTRFNKNNRFVSGARIQCPEEIFYDLVSKFVD